MEVTIPKTSAVMTALLRADFTTMWRNRRSVILVLVLPVIIVFSWKGFIKVFGGAFVLSNALTLGLVAIGLMGYTNSLARDREKGVFQRLRVSPVPPWAIMGSRLIVQLVLILVLTLVVFISGNNFDQITLTPISYVLTVLSSIAGGAVYLALGQVIVGSIKNSETVNSTTRLVYFCFILVGMFGQFMNNEEVKEAVHWTPYGTVKTILAASMTPGAWSNQTTMALLATIGYTIVFATLGIKWFKWDSK
jgi:ABC-2 type transport system permease protein